METQNIISKYKSAYRGQDSTEQSLVGTLDLFRKAMDWRRLFMVVGEDLVWLNGDDGNNKEAKISAREAVE